MQGSKKENSVAARIESSVNKRKIEGRATNTASDLDENALRNLSSDTAPCREEIISQNSNPDLVTRHDENVVREKALNVSAHYDENEQHGLNSNMSQHRKESISKESNSDVAIRHDNIVRQLDADLAAIKDENTELKETIIIINQQLEKAEARHREAVAKPYSASNKNVDVIVPVYAGLEETQECIESTLSSIPDWAQLIVINDCSPEPELTEWLRERSRDNAFLLLENETNLGFVATVNRGMQLHLRNDVLLLNSDVEVANDWLERMRDAAYSIPQVGSITPFSNNATICSFPNFCEDNELMLGLNVKQLDDHFSSYGTLNNLVEIPTGIGFCMYIRRDCLNQVGYFDVETFGRGYGEENDWCQRADKLGWKNYHQLNVFAYHKGGVSFAGEQSPRKTRAMELLAELHPNYTADVMRFISADPAKKARQQIMARLISTSLLPKVLLVSHKMSGGVVTHLNELIGYFKNKVHFLLLSPGEKEGTYALALTAEGTAGKDRIIFELDSGLDELTNLLNFAGVGSIHYHHIMGFDKEILSLHEQINCSYDITVHDYFLVNGNPTLTDRNGRFCGDDLAIMDDLCIKHYPVPMYMPLETWREHVSLWLQGAKRVIFPSTDTQARYARIYPNADYNAISAWHIDHHAKLIDVPVIKPEKNNNLKVLIIGAISKEKGAVLLEEVAISLSGHPVDFTLMGYAFRPLNSTINVLGSYSDTDIKKILAEVQADVVWYPAQWPETYSYTLSIALENSLPVIVPNIGAFPERIENREFSKVIAWDMSVSALKDFFLQLAKDPGCLNDQQNQTNILSSECIERDKEFYLKHYICPEWNREGKLGIIDYKTLIFQTEVTKTISEQLSNKEVYLAKLWRMTQQPGIRVIARLIPYRLQRYVKRKLSNRAIHEIVK